jgi:hypothetical protein
MPNQHTGPVFPPIGTRYNFLTFVGDGGSDKIGSRKWVMKCDCGAVKTVRASCVKTSGTVSCGCYARTNLGRRAYKHGGKLAGKHTPEYLVWVGIKTRCLNPNDPGYKNYGGRGIRVCDLWKDDFGAFLRDMGPRPRGLSIGRVDNDGHYEPGNCRWETAEQQARNKRSTKLNEKKVFEIRAALSCGARRQELAVQYGVSRATIRRIQLNEIWITAAEKERE